MTMPAKTFFRCTAVVGTTLAITMLAKNFFAVHGPSVDNTGCYDVG